MNLVHWKKLTDDDIEDRIDYLSLLLNKSKDHVITTSIGRYKREDGMKLNIELNYKDRDFIIKISDNELLIDNLIYIDKTNPYMNKQNSRVKRKFNTIGIDL